MPRTEHPPAMSDADADHAEASGLSLANDEARHPVVILTSTN